MLEQQKSEEEGEASKNCYGLIPAPIPHIPALLETEPYRSVDTEENSWAWEEVGEGFQALSLFLMLIYF